ncbi:MAG: hypothetical protein H7331_09930, partial [Bacteroidia bacterium]|nr:hypothetical protein [Bacteroidia bacterium]
MKNNYNTSLAVIVLILISINAKAQYCTSSLYLIGDNAIDSVAITPSSFTANNIGISNTSTMYSSYITNDTLMVGNTYIIHTKINGGDGSVGA